MTPALPLANWLADLSTTALAELLYHRRQSLAGYRIHNFHSLADLLQDPWSLARVLPTLPLPAIQVIEAHAALGATVPIDALAGLLTATGTDDEHRGHVVAVLDLLAARGLVWSGDGVYTNIATGFAELAPSPLGLGTSAEVFLARLNTNDIGRTLRELGLPRTGPRTRLEAAMRGFYLDAEQIRAEIRGAPREISAELEAEATGTRKVEPGYDVDRYRLEQQLITWGRSRGILFGSYGSNTVMPCQVRLALRGTGFRAPFEPAPGEVPVAGSPAGQITGEAGARASEFLAAVTMVLDRLASHPATTLKDGGLGVREITKLAKGSRVPQSRVTTVLALARALGLSSENDSRVTVSDHYRRWNLTEADTRLARLVEAWWMLPYIPTLVEETTPKATMTIIAAAARIDDRALRQATIKAIIELGEWKSFSDLAALSARITWRHPLLVAGRHGAVPAIVAEAQQLGVLGGTACSPVGLALSSMDERALRTAATATLPAVAMTATFGSDLTVLVAGSPAAAISSLLDACATRESSGNASLWRFSQASVRRALDAGRSAPDLLSALTEIGGAPLPQPLEYLITDIGRRHGVVTVVAGLCCLRSADTALLSEICADRSLKLLGLQAIAPTVAVSAQNTENTLVALRAAGYLPGAAVDALGTTPVGTEKPLATIDLGAIRADHSAAIDQPRNPTAPPTGSNRADEKPSRRRARAMAEALLDGSPATW